VNFELESKLQEGLAYCAEKAWQSAAQAFEAVLVLEPSHAVAWNNLGNVRDELSDSKGALSAYQNALHLMPDYVSAKTNLSIVSHKVGATAYAKGELAQALAAFELASLTVSAMGQCNADYDHSYLQLLLETCTHDKVSQLVEAMQARFSELPNYRLHPYPLLAAVDAPLWHLKVATRHAEKLCEETGMDIPPSCRVAKAHLFQPSPSGRTRIAYLSSDWHQHPVPQQLLASIEAHDRTQWEVIGVATDTQADASYWRQRIEQAFDRFYALGHLSDRDIADQLRELEIEVAVDLSLYMENGRPLILASRPCEKQVAFLGYAGTSGAPWIDYIIADNVTIPCTHEKFYSERMMRLTAATFMPDNNQRPSIAAPIDRASSRRAQGLPAEAFVFCAFSNPYKITPAMLSLWFRLLHQIPHSVLWLQANNDLAQYNISQAGALAGLAPERLVFARRVSSFAAHLQRYPLADLFLDTYPYNAHVTAADALWAGLPVLTLQGESFASRVASSILTALGVPELIATSTAAYSHLAQQLANEPTQISSFRQRLLTSKERALYFNQTSYVDRLESAYRSIISLP
jgi:protein O-GlcNAc transferase